MEPSEDVGRVLGSRCSDRNGRIGAARGHRKAARKRDRAAAAGGNGGGRLLSRSPLTTLHPHLTMEDVRDGGAVLVTFPWCGRLEIWSVDELQGHGACRHQPRPCPWCDED